MAELVEDENVIAELRRIDLTQSPASKLGDGLRRRRGGGPGPGTAGYGAGAGIEPFGDESRTDLTRAEPSLGKVDRPAETTAVANRNQGKSPPESTRDIEQAAEAAKPHRVEKGADDSDRAAIRARLARDRAEERVRRRKKRWRILVRDSPFYLLVGVVVVVAGWLELRSPTGGGTEPTSSPLPIKIDSVQTDARPKDVPPGWNERGPGVGESVRFIVKLKNPGRKSLEMAYLAANIYRDKDYEPGSMGHSPFYVVFTLADAQGWLERPEKGSTEPLAESHSTFVSVLYDDRCAESAKPRIEKMTESRLDDGKTNARAISADKFRPTQWSARMPYLPQA
ncbi:hypothetical protein G5V59_12955 [Nocardioides sp. W3-2-3]|uniref:hypothetical protein n=1 Tax=Nocardioides convexus TaxID=2712224 RepID=UPI002418735C|nr:hypothetical protein [Nocardioides convexus]NHA00623.1 hypothetical protein [Nocardioides convexus]